MEVLIFYFFIFEVIYLAWCDFTIDPTKEQRWCNLLVQGYHWCWALDLQLWPSDKATIIPMEKSRSTETKKDDTGEEQSQENAHHFLWHQGDCSKRICPSKLNSHFRILPWCFMVTAWKCVKTWPRNLTTKELAVISQQHTISHFIFHQGIFYQKQHDCLAPTDPTRLTWPFATFLCFFNWR
jgi:hypothetical protein